MKGWKNDLGRDTFQGTKGSFHSKRNSMDPDLHRYSKNQQILMPYASTGT